MQPITTSPASRLADSTPPAWQPPLPPPPPPQPPTPHSDAGIPTNGIGFAHLHPPFPSSPTLRPSPWIPSFRLSVLLGVTGLGPLIGTILGSYVGPIIVQGYGPPTSSQSLQIQLLSFASIAGGFTFSVAGVRLQGSRVLAPPLTGLAVLLVGLALSFYFVPNPAIGAPCGNNCGFVAPYTLQGGLIADWGLAVLLFGLILPSSLRRFAARRRSSHSFSRVGAPGGYSPRQVQDIMHGQSLPPPPPQ